MDILGQLLQQATGATGGDTGAAPQVDVGALAQQFGLTPDQANAAVGALLPAVLGGLKKVEQGGGLGSVADIAGATSSPATDTDAGNAVLGQIFGSKDVSRSVATAASAQTGISDTIMDYKKGPLFLRAGRQSISWGESDDIVFMLRVPAKMLTIACFEGGAVLHRVSIEMGGAAGLRGRDGGNDNRQAGERQSDQHRISPSLAI